MPLSTSTSAACAASTIDCFDGDGCAANQPEGQQGKQTHENNRQVDAEAIPEQAQREAFHAGVPVVRSSRRA